ncbi:PAS domain S-box protein [Nitrogeniibacter mangrovi]|uniref:histidine kinase n=1 Tax=Nitrogeniibacter mangrovi TaxID=2016596 RepID=A0A6C1B779_9RHOO|nr:ATP-binding protein [Nitrogeniibacter mangrovi]QID18588.1 PAS domain S-box protein [Nitrogeniibacter mangrovi]
MSDTDHRAYATTPAWYWRLPSITLGLMLVGIVALIWMTRHFDDEKQRETLINDVLWMEQDLRFRLDRNEEYLGQIGQSLLTENEVSTKTDGRLQQLLRPDSGLVQVLWLDASGKLIGGRPYAREDVSVGETRGALPSSETSRLAQAVGRPVYGGAYPVIGNKWRFNVHVPIFSGSHFIGTVVGVYSLPQLVVRQLPWWFSERYRVSVHDADGREIATKSKVEAEPGHQQYSIPFDPPGYGLTLKVTAYKAPTRWIPVLLISALVFLGGVIVWSLWQLRQHTIGRQQAEMALREQMSYRRAMEDSLLTGLRARDMEGRITFVNPAFCRMTGFSEAELVGAAPPMPYWDPETIERTRAIHDEILASGAPREGVEIRFRHKDGHMIDALIFEAPLIDASGTQTGWMGSFLDITSQKRAEALARQQEERLQATSRLITMGEMASTLAHELNQPLAAISSYSSGCLNQLEKPLADTGELRDIIGKITRQARRAGDIIRRVHDFVRRSEPKRETIDLNAVITDAVGLIEPDARKRVIQIDADLAAQALPVNADPVMLEQVAVNLIRNGMDAMRDVTDRPRIIHVATFADDQQVHLRVVDAGRGIDPDATKRIFDPFFTTKDEGMGMGLNICRSIAELHDGRLSFEPNPDGGTIFTFSLPHAT